MLVDRVADPVHPWVVSDCVVDWVDEDYFIVLVSGVLIDPVRVENPKATQLATSTLFSDRPLAPLELQLGNTLVCGLTIDNTLRNRPLTTTSPHSNTVNHNALLGLVTKATSLVRASRTSDTNNGRELAVLPASHPLDEPHHSHTRRGVVGGLSYGSERS